MLRSVYVEEEKKEEGEKKIEEYKCVQAVRLILASPLTHGIA